MKSFATDTERNSVCAYGVFSGTHTGQGGPCPPTGKSLNSDYVYVMEFEGDKLRHMTKIWNAGWAVATLASLGTKGRTFDLSGRTCRLALRARNSPSIGAAELLANRYASRGSSSDD